MLFFCVSLCSDQCQAVVSGTRRPLHVRLLMLSVILLGLKMEDWTVDAESVEWWMEGWSERWRVKMSQGGLKDRWGMGRWVKNKSCPSHPSSSVRSNTFLFFLFFSPLLLCLTPCIAIFCESAPPPHSFFPLSVGSTAGLLHILSFYNIPEVFVWNRGR